MMQVDTAAVVEASGGVELVAMPSRAITFKVYGVRVERTETAVHMAFGPFLRDPNRPALCPCVSCQREHRDYYKWPKF
jgi:hypothetical protein